MVDAVTKLPTPDRIALGDCELGEKRIDGAVVRPLTFQSFVDLLATAQAMTQPKSWDARLKRLRMLKQVTYYHGNTIVSMAQEDILRLPIPAARLITSKLDQDEGISGKVIRDGDGIDKAITYELGTPIPLGQGKESIKELEFFAKTYGDIEDVLAADNAMSQAAVLISTVGKPLGTSLTLLPSWAVNLITVADGVTISREILPRFLGSPDE
jgi:hypothetical protein